MKILIADDELLARQRLKLLLQDINPSHDTYADASNGIEALQQCIDHKPQLALLDIRMPMMDGLQVAAEIQKAHLGTHVIFTTAYDEYAVKAFEHNAIDYLLKPVKQSRLEQSLEKISRLSQADIKPTLSKLDLHAPRQHLCAHSHSGLDIIALKDILYFKADHKYVIAATSQREILLDDSLKALEQEFEPQFFRIHRNALVNIDAIASISKTISGQFNVQLRDCDQSLIISRRHQAELNRLLRQKHQTTD